MKSHRWSFTRNGSVFLPALVALAACSRPDPNQLLGGGSGATAPCPASTVGGTTSSSSAAGSSGSSSSTSSSSSSTGGSGTPLDNRVLSYSEALRTAAIKLLGTLPTLNEIEQIRKASDQKAAYTTIIDQYLADPRFASRMLEFWKNTFRMANTEGPNQTPSFDSAPIFAARVTVEGLPYTSLFTADKSTCPTFDPEKGAFADGDCPANGPETVGLLTNQGILANYFGNFAFRRLRFYQEVFSCQAAPAEWGPPVILEGGAAYTSPWPFESIAGTKNGGRVDFLDHSSSVCANCHSTWNHRAPLFAVFDDKGAYQAPTGTGPSTVFAVPTPLPMPPDTMLSDYLPAGEAPAWKFNVPASTMKELGQAMAEDDDVRACAVRRMWNYAMSKGDIVYDISPVPSSVIQPLIDDFKANNFNLRATIRAIFVHDDFVRF